MDIDGSRPRQFQEDVEVIAEYMHRVAGVKTILVLGPGGGFEPIIKFTCSPAPVLGCASARESPLSGSSVMRPESA